MWIVAVLVNHLIEIEEASLGYALLAEDLDAGAALRVVWHEPCRAEGNDARISADRGGRILLEGIVQFLGGDEVGREGSAGEKGGEERGRRAERGTASRVQARGMRGKPQDGDGGHLGTVDDFGVARSVRWIEESRVPGQSVTLEWPEKAESRSAAGTCGQGNGGRIDAVVGGQKPQEVRGARCEMDDTVIVRERSCNFWGGSANWSHFFDKETVTSMYVTVCKGPCT
jgi:hypothetical protein